MRFFVTADINSESEIDKVLFAFNTTIQENFEAKDYESELLKNLSIVLMCRDPRHNFKQRIRLSKSDKYLEIDIMLHLPDIIQMSHEEKCKHVAKKLIDEVPVIIQKYIKNRKALGFDLLRFTQDLKDFFVGIGWY